MSQATIEPAVTLQVDGVTPDQLNVCKKRMNSYFSRSYSGMPDGLRPYTRQRSDERCLDVYGMVCVEDIEQCIVDIRLLDAEDISWRTKPMRRDERKAKLEQLAVLRASRETQR